MSFPDLDDFPGRHLVDDGSHEHDPRREQLDDESRARARAFLEQTSFEKVTVGSAVRQVKELLTDDDGSVRQDNQLGGNGERGELWAAEEKARAGGCRGVRLRRLLVIQGRRGGRPVAPVRPAALPGGAATPGRPLRAQRPERHRAFFLIFTLICGMTWGVIGVLQSRNSAVEAAEQAESDRRDAER